MNNYNHGKKLFMNPGFGKLAHNQNKHNLYHNFIRNMDLSDDKFCLQLNNEGHIKYRFFFMHI